MGTSGSAEGRCGWMFCTSVRQIHKFASGCVRVLCSIEPRVLGGYWVHTLLPQLSCGQQDEEKSGH